MINIIKAWNNRGKSFDIKCHLGIGIWSALKDSAQKKVQLPDDWRKKWSTLNEIYLSFMDPNGQIINIQFVQQYEAIENAWVVLHQMYFKQGSEHQRLLIFEELRDGVLNRNADFDDKSTIKISDSHKKATVRDEVLHNIKNLTKGENLDTIPYSYGRDRKHVLNYKYLKRFVSPQKIKQIFWDIEKPGDL